MKRVLFIFCLIVFFATPVFCEDEFAEDFNGVNWIRFSNINKQLIIGGIWIGQNPSCLDKTTDYKYRYAKNTLTSDYMKEMDEFYSKPKHRKIKILDAYVLATVKFKDNDSNDYEYILDLLLEEKRLPYFITVIRVIDGDTIEVEQIRDKKLNEPEESWTVRLIGIDAPEINHKNQTDKEKYGMKAKQFLEALCLDHAGKLIYSEDIFDKYGRLLAQFELDFDSLVSRHLLWYGLARPYPYRDPKRTDKVAFLDVTDELYARDAETAKQKQLYIWGGKKDPHVEQTINQHLAK